MAGRRSGKFWLVLALLIAPLPSVLTKLVYRTIFGYEIGKRVRIGCSIILAGSCEIGDDVYIGHLNVLVHTKQLSIGNQVKINFGNILRGGRSVVINDRSSIDRFNEITSIVRKLPEGEADGHLVLGRSAVIVAKHKVDFTGGVEFGDNAILGGRLSSLWTHNRQALGAISVGANTYLGSGIQIAPGASVASHCVVGLGSVITKPLKESLKLYGGAPAKAIRDLEEEDMVLVTYTTRPDLEYPDD